MAVNSGDVSNLSGASLFPNATWLHQGPPPSGVSLASVAGQYTAWVQTADSASNSYGFPIQEADGSNGYTTFSDNFNHSITVPNPTGGYTPAGGTDGHLVVVDPNTGQYFDFWTLSVDANGNPTSTHVGRIEQGNYQTGDGTPGTTAVSVTGLAGDILPGELSTANGIQHALNVATPSNLTAPGHGNQGPPGLSGADGSANGGVFQEGQEIFIPQSVNVDALNVSTAVKSIMHALQNYGGLITDNAGGTLGFYSDISSSQMPDLTGLDQIEQYLEITTNSSTHSSAGTGTGTTGTAGSSGTGGAPAPRHRGADGDYH
jgi:hypothetical protein